MCDIYTEVQLLHLWVIRTTNSIIEIIKKMMLHPLHLYLNELNVFMVLALRL